ncbi:cysteine-rich motor neuron 1 protein-like [Haliotis rufescens]|uniref:cysteine-rich motor neuron 1 protein-like n=1 Tax=Haliotis rufescens TaxID=6454 RepID=UPI00201F952F|nr:cysteine-rich motor neuron 1 protein-like [Haliotis rufescens]
MLLLLGVLVLASVTPGVSGACVVEGVVRDDWEEWESGCDVCFCQDGETICDNICDDVMFVDNPCYKPKGALCEEYGCYNIWDEPYPFAPDEELPIVPLGDVTVPSDQSCTCERGYPYVLCTAS